MDNGADYLRSRKSETSSPALTQQTGGESQEMLRVQLKIGCQQIGVSKGIKEMW